MGEDARSGQIGCFPPVKDEVPGPASTGALGFDGGYARGGTAEREAVLGLIDTLLANPVHVPPGVLPGPYREADRHVLTYLREQIEKGAHRQ